MAVAVASARDLSTEDSRRGVDGGSKSQASGDLHQLVLTCNKDGMEFLRNGLYKQAFEQLKYAEAVLDSQMSQGEDSQPTNLHAVTCNNLGCYYKKVGKLHAALSYLRKALKIELSLQTDNTTVAGTHLNICAILSKLDKHDKAVQHAECALQLSSASVSAAGDAATQEECSVLAISYHNVAVEQDYLQKWDLAAEAYQQGHQIAKRTLGEQHPLTQTLGRHCESAVQKSQKLPQARPPLSNSAREAQRRQAQNHAGSRQTSLDPPKNRTRSDSPTGQSNQNGSKSGALPDIQDAANVRITKDFAQPGAAMRQVQEVPNWSNASSVGQLPALTGRGPTQASNAVPFGHVSSHSNLGGPFVPGAMMGPASSAGSPPPPPPLEASSAMHSAAFLEKLHTEVPAAAQLASDPRDPPPLVYDRPPPSGSAVASRTARSQGRDLLTDTSPSEDHPPPPPGVVPRPPSGGRRGISRTGTNFAARRAQRDLIRAQGGAAPVGTLKADQAPAGGLAGGLRPQESQLLRKTAAERIQRVWRSSYNRRTAVVRTQKRERLAATKIQARYRGFMVVRRRQNAAATSIQRLMRGFLVRMVHHRRRAATRIQRHSRGFLCRRMMLRKLQAAIVIQRFARGKLARNRVQARRKQFNDSALLLQCAWRRKQAYKTTSDLRAIKREKEAREASACTIQRVFRGQQGRRRFAGIRQAHMAEENEHASATRIQSAFRCHRARRQVAEMRRLKKNKHDLAATIIRKCWLRYYNRKRYLNLKKELGMHVSSVITLQRYVRGYLVRSRMWKDAIRVEEELWASVEIQRCWRGYRGRLRWEMEWERVTSREAAAAKLQRAIRGWLARTRTDRIRKKKARAEFQRARLRFKSAQRIQAVVRGHQCRKRMHGYRQRQVAAVTKIQSNFRGHRLRIGLWAQQVERNTVRIQAAARGFLVRNRRFQVLVKIICIQHNYRKWHRYVPEAERARRVEAWKAARAASRANADGAAACEELAVVPVDMEAVLDVGDQTQASAR